MSDSDIGKLPDVKKVWLAEARKHIRAAQKRRAKAKEEARKGRMLEHVRR